MMVATRFGSRFEADAHFEMESAQCSTSGRKMGERLAVTRAGVIFQVMETGVVCIASVPSSALMRMTVRGMIVKPDKQPLPASSWGAACVAGWNVF